MEIMNKPLLICMTPVRNEAWVLHAFLKATSLWADYIIIADQMSTDGSREIALSYPKVILIDNDNPDFNEAERQGILIDRAREIKGDKILFGLDADEVFSANFMKTNDWAKIQNSKQGDVFWFKWALICPDQVHYWDYETFFPWAFHDDGKEPHGNYVRKMHSMRIPYPIDEKQMFYIVDFKVLHLTFLNLERVYSKLRFYKFLDWEINQRSVVQLSRNYSYRESTYPVFVLNSDFVYSKSKFGFDLFQMIEIDSIKFWFDDYLIKSLMKYKSNETSKLDIWDKSFLTCYKLSDPRPFGIKLFHFYLHYTNKYSSNIVVRIIDTIFKKMNI